MSVLANTQQKLMQTTALIAKEEQALATSPEFSRAIQSSIRSLEKMRVQLEHEFALAASRIGYDVCKYRLFSDENK